MPIYTPRYFAGDSGPAARQVIERHPFATLVTSVAGAEPHITYLPLLLDEGALHGHIARANPHWQQFRRGGTVALFQGPHAFVSPYWYETPADNVPTWNYAVVHVHGEPAVTEDAAAAMTHLQRLFARFDDGRGLPTEPVKLQRLLGGIVPFRMPIARIEAKFKMSQNKPPADRAGVIAGLRGTGRAEDRAVADWMQAHAGD